MLKWDFAVQPSSLRKQHKTFYLGPFNFLYWKVSTATFAHLVLLEPSTDRRKRLAKKLKVSGNINVVNICHLSFQRQVNSHPFIMTIAGFNCTSAIQRYISIHIFLPVRLGIKKVKSITDYMQVNLPSAKVRHWHASLSLKASHWRAFCDNWFPLWTFRLWMQDLFL